jgi:hypothetical protein
MLLGGIGILISSLLSPCCYDMRRRFCMGTKPKNELGENYSDIIGVKRIKSIGIFGVGRKR